VQEKTEQEPNEIDAMAVLRFTKMHGIGNDYVYVDVTDRTLDDPAAVARKVSPRHTGVGSDGLILIDRSDVADCRMEMYNADGSRGEMCGNGIRCVGKYVYDNGICRRDTLTVETDAGIKTLFLTVRGSRVIEATVDMGPPILDGRAIPVNADGEVIDAPLEIHTPDGSETFLVTCVSMGNPHCVVFVDDVENLPLSTLGPRFETDPFFPKRVNTEFVRVDNLDDVRMRVWERGSGETAACGTGACAVVVAGVLTQRTQRRCRVRLNGGTLEVEWRAEDGHVYMTGPAEEVFRGEIEI